MKTYVVTGAASGIGAATTELLRAQGHRTVGIDRTQTDGVDVVADLSTPHGRSLAVTGTLELASELDGIVASAGIGGGADTDPALLVSVNYFGVVDVLAGLRSAVKPGGAVVVVSSNSISSSPAYPAPLARELLRGNEQRARKKAACHSGVMAYPASKAALAWWVRREAPAWLDGGVRVNAVAPGLIDTPLSQAIRQDRFLADQLDRYPSMLGRGGYPSEVAPVIAFLLSDEARLMIGTTVFVDGGTDALVNPRQPSRWDTGWLPSTLVSLGFKVASRLRRR